MQKFFGAAAFAVAMSFAAAAQAQFLIIGNDEKLIFKDGKPALSLPGKDTVTIVDIKDPTKPRIVANLPAQNSVIGPPTNLAITPDNKLALVASSIDVVKDGDNLKNVPDNKVFVIDLTTRRRPSLQPCRPASSLPAWRSIAQATWRWSPTAPTTA
ncbi:MAG: hypothetical protein ACTHJS_07265 [Xanthobacteraceae bacterium]